MTTVELKPKRPIAWVLFTASDGHRLSIPCYPLGIMREVHTAQAFQETVDVVFTEGKKDEWVDKCPKCSN